MTRKIHQQLLRANHWSGPKPASDCRLEEVSAALNLLFAFDGEFRKALLGRSASLPGVGHVSARQFFAVLDGLTRALLAPDINRTSRINLFNSPMLSNLPNHEPQTWEEQPFTSCRLHIVLTSHALSSHCCRTSRSAA